VTTTILRVILPVPDIEAAEAFYARLLDQPGRRVSPERHYFDCGDVILACHQPGAHGDSFAGPNPDYVYFAEPDLETAFERAKAAGCCELDETIESRPWGERSFYAKDPFGNPLCFVDAATVFTGR
jgi:catechol 2,3-dioxygenase-like lactoylglutathione lyase family enzyme